MTSQILDTLRVTRACEISSIKADLLNLTAPLEEAKKWERVRRMREALSLLSDKIESDYKQMAAYAKLREREVEKAKIKARISDLKAEITELEAKL